VTIVRVDAQVVEGNRIVTGLDRGDFAVWDEGRKQSVEYFGRDSEPVDLLLLLDVSGSMRRYLEQMAAVAGNALGQLKPGDRVAVMLFSRRTQVREEFTENYGEVAREIRDAVKEKGLGAGTAINESIIAAAGYVRTQPVEGRRAIVILTDNQGLNYRLPDEEVLKALFEADCVLNGIVVGSGERPAPPKPGVELNPDFTPPDVFKLAEETGAEAVKADRADKSFQEMVERLRTRYSLHYRAPDAPADSYRSIRVDLSPTARQRHRRAEVRARRGYYVR